MDFVTIAARLMTTTYTRSGAFNLNANLSIVSCGVVKDSDPANCVLLTINSADQAQSC